MRGDSESRSRYLALALVSRRTIDHLRSVTVGGAVDPDLDESLQKLLASTDPVADAKFVSHLEAPGAWTYFEDLSTVDELRQETGFIDLGDTVAAVLNPGTQEARVQNAKRLIGFLTAVEGRALQHYADSTEIQFA